MLQIPLGERERERERERENRWKVGEGRRNRVGG